MEITWQKVLEIETYLNTPYKNESSVKALFFPRKINRRINVNLDKKYSHLDLIQYLQAKYPASLNLKIDLLNSLFSRAYRGEKIIEVDEELYDLNFNQNKYKLSKLELEENFLDYWIQITGTTSFFIHLLKDLIDKSKEKINTEKISRIEIRKDFIEIASALKSDRKIKLFFESKILSDFDKLQKTILEYTELTSFQAFISSCLDLNYSPPFTSFDKTNLISKTIDFSLKHVLSIIDNETEDLFDFRILKKLSPYPEDIRKHKHDNVCFNISFYGLVNFDKVIKLKENRQLLTAVKNYLSSSFNLLSKEGIFDSYNPNSSSNDIEKNCSIVIGRNTKIETLYNSFLDTYHDKIMNGIVWYFDDDKGIFYDYLNYHDKTDVGKYKHSISFDNVLYKYLVVYLECTGAYNRKSNELKAEGYWETKEQYLKSKV